MPDQEKCKLVLHGIFMIISVANHLCSTVISDLSPEREVRVPSFAITLLFLLALM